KKPPDYSKAMSFTDLPCYAEHASAKCSSKTRYRLFFYPVTDDILTHSGIKPLEHRRGVVKKL
ncbi:hypothetical protein, partial [Yersinia pestis]